MVPPLPLTRPASRHSGRVCASLATWRGKTLSLSSDMRRESSIASLSLRPSWCVSRSTSSSRLVRQQPVPPRKQPLRFPLSWRGWRSCWQRVRRQPCAAGRKHHRIVNPCPGAKRKTTGASEGDRSQALPRGRLRDFDQPGQRTSVKRGGTRRRGVRSEASIPRRTESQGY